MKLEFGLGTYTFPFSNDLELNFIIQTCSKPILTENPEDSSKNLAERG
jgi:hypothetical protein